MTIKDVRYVDGNLDALKSQRRREFSVDEGRRGIQTAFFDPQKNNYKAVVGNEYKEQTTLIGALRNSNPNFEAWLRDQNDDLPDGPIINQASEKEGPLAEIVRIAQMGWYSIMPDGRLPEMPTKEEQDALVRKLGRSGFEDYMAQEFYAGGGYSHPTYNADHGHVSKYEVENLERFVKNFFEMPKGRDWEISDLGAARVKPAYVAFSPELLTLRDALSGRYEGVRPSAINETLSNYRRDMNVAKNRGEITFDSVPRLSGSFTNAVSDKFSGLNGLSVRHDAVPVGWRPSAPV